MVLRAVHWRTVLSVIGALLPMGAVTGMMGPYMLPIPVLGSVAMGISLFAAFVFTPWLTNVMLEKRYAASAGGGHHEDKGGEGLLAFFSKVMTPFLGGDRGNRNRWLLLSGIILLIAAAISMAAFKIVVLKMLPFDNKGEFQVVLDMPEGTALPATANAAREMAETLRQIPEITALQSYTGTARPFDFNGMVRHYYLRQDPWLAEIQVQLLHKSERQRTSHEIAEAARQPARLDDRGAHDSRSGSQTSAAMPAVASSDRAWPSRSADSTSRRYWQPAQGSTRNTRLWIMTAMQMLIITRLLSL